MKPCYRKNGCGPYEMLSCSECPASKPEYANQYKTDKPAPDFSPENVKSETAVSLSEDTCKQAIYIINNLMTDMQNFSDFINKNKVTKDMISVYMDSLNSASDDLNSLFGNHIFLNELKEVIAGLNKTNRLIEELEAKIRNNANN